MSWGPAELERRVAGGAKLARITAVDPAKGRAKVSFGGETESAWLPWMAMRGQGVRVWAPPVVGEQVYILSPGGDTAQGVILGSVFKAGDAPSSRGDEFRAELGDAVWSMVEDRVVASVKGADVEVEGDRIALSVGGASISVEDGEIKLSVGGASVSLTAGGLGVDAPSMSHRGKGVGRDHRHRDVSRGSSESGPPV